MARTSVTEVREIIETSIEDDVVEGNFIATANALLDSQLAANPDCVITDALLAKMEMYLAAHFIAVSDDAQGGGKGALKYTKLGDASESYDTSQLTKGMGSTRYGQAAQMLDTCGLLSDLAGGVKLAQFRVV